MLTASVRFPVPRAYRQDGETSTGTKGPSVHVCAEYDSGGVPVARLAQVLARY